jgi:hypothetical protein
LAVQLATGSGVGGGTGTGVGGGTGAGAGGGAGTGAGAGGGCGGVGLGTGSGSSGVPVGVGVDGGSAMGGLLVSSELSSPQPYNRPSAKITNVMMWNFILNLRLGNLTSRVDKLLQMQNQNFKTFTKSLSANLQD